LLKIWQNSEKINFVFISIRSTTISGVILSLASTFIYDANVCVQYVFRKYSLLIVLCKIAVKHKWSEKRNIIFFRQPFNKNKKVLFL